MGNIRMYFIIFLLAGTGKSELARKQGLAQS